ncbi:hypothetical protein AB4212_65785, partial [Streptomyces sp. 2MCAF27]
MEDTTYPELLGTIGEFAGKLDPKEQVARLYDLMVPLLDRVVQEEEEFSDEPVVTPADVVRGLRQVAVGELADVDAVYEQLTAMGLYYCEDQDPERHVVSQTAFAAAVWLRLLTGRELRATSLDDDEDLVPPFAPSEFTQIIDLLAWTRSGQTYMFWGDALTNPDFCDFPAAMRELGAIHREITASG